MLPVLATIANNDALSPTFEYYIYALPLQNFTIQHQKAERGPLGSRVQKFLIQDAPAHREKRLLVRCACVRGEVARAGGGATTVFSTATMSSGEH